MRKVSVLGLGNWGTALANHLANNNCAVTAWSLEAEVVEGINSSKRNPRYQSEVDLHESLTATLDLEQALENETIVLVVPSSALTEVVPKLKLKDGSVVISAIKGLEMEHSITPLTYIEQILKDSVKLAVLSGPSFAYDIVRGLPCGVVAASKFPEVAKDTAELFSAGSMRVYTSDDPLGVELGGILKNVMAIAVGVCDGLEFGDSARASLVTRSLAEMTRLAVALGANAKTLTGLSGLGDLVLTATCDKSRNRTVGLRLGKGQSLPMIIDSLGSVAEGVRTTPIVLKIASRLGIEMPIASEVAKLISGEVKPQHMAESLLFSSTQSGTLKICLKFLKYT